MWKKNPPVNQKLPEFFPFQTRGMLYSVMHTRAHTHARTHARTHAHTHILATADTAAD